MEEVIGLIVDALAKSARGKQPSPPAKPPQPPEPPPSGRLDVRLPTAAQRPAPRPAPARRPTPAMPAPADPFAVAPPAPHPSAAGASLLSAFTSRERLLAAIVLSEALGAPVALRNDNSLRSRDVLGPDAEN